MSGTDATWPCCRCCADQCDARGRHHVSCVNCQPDSGVDR